MSRSELKRALAHKMPQVARQWRQLADLALAEFGVSNSAGWCLIYLDRLGPDVRQADLAEELGIAQPSLVRTLDQLQAAGLVERVPNPDDRRSNRVAFTPEGQELVGRIEARLENLRRELLDGVPDAAIEIIVNLLNLLERRMAERRGQS
ncbi:MULTISPECIES: MarR family winged helix-turn-helix transcriptional regulator [Sphingobium]|jgi:MarR family transcriptional regulator for hemolysin|uniref:MarR family transcriptional regulator n=2 Tax=Sphingobium fuliginis (strain ATCC 27551) TaxID=336203 RepID=A0A4Q4J5S5_SPHSA|nr:MULTISPECIES: MarR family transcriptional regulator [Sphingobium]OAP32114.1 MarR family transcriptional regulator [Sphingobium sp. 20006FA]AJR22967.1 MarR family transcriptional regulator [Sphingobium sp. YBL2]KXU32756.1 MarR family transcriptional regulator [Sphingobium sp. AM]KYC32837.1 MarR family transcriptional regulator [Sphingobium sp. 22B]MCB4861913.1 MarR family transcriptional regulator [Sphingobium sp. PNB]